LAEPLGMSSDTELAANFMAASLAAKMNVFPEEDFEAVARIDDPGKRLDAADALMHRVFEQHRAMIDRTEEEWERLMAAMRRRYHEAEVQVRASTPGPTK
jgi:hypothetical protein